MVPPDPGRRHSKESLRVRRRRIIMASLLFAAVVGMAGCAGRSSPQDRGLRGVGTPGVSSYPGDSQATTLQALQDRCRQVPSQARAPSGTQDLGAACSQFHRTMHSQPGNTVEPGAAP